LLWLSCNQVNANAPQVVQELNSSKAALTNWGGHSVDSFLVALVALRIRFDAKVTYLLYAEAPSMALTFAANMVSWQVRGIADDAKDTLICLSIASKYRVSDPRDCIYARLGVLSFLANHITVDYTLSTTQVLLDAAKAFVNHGEDLSILSAVHHVHYPGEAPLEPCCSRSDIAFWDNSIQKPSWVPRWDCPPRARVRGSTARAGFNAWAGESVWNNKFCREVSSDQSLVVEALVVDKVSSATVLDLKDLALDIVESEEEIEIRKSSSYRQARCNTWCKLIRKLRGIDSDRETLAAYERALTFGSGFAPHYRKYLGLKGLDGSLAMFLHHLLKPLQSDESAIYWQNPDGLKVPDPTTYDDEQTSKAQPSSLESFNIHAFQTLVHAIQNYRSFIWTSGGHIGSGPVITQAGDTIAIILGSSVPFVVRERQDGTFLLIGECYIDGIMFGEAVGDWKAGKMPGLEKKRITIV
jgi:hypothetical protein